MAKEYKRRMRGQPGDAIRQDNLGNVIAVSTITFLSLLFILFNLSVLNPVTRSKSGYIQSVVHSPKHVFLLEYN